MNKTSYKILNGLVPGLILGLCLTSLSFQAQSDDIDIYVGSSAGAGDNPNVLFILDNTANWSGNDQDFPGEKQGEAEVAAIKAVINDAAMSGVVDNMNIGVMEFVTDSNTNDGGFIRHHISPMSNAANKAALSAKLDTIYGDINGPPEKRNANLPYGYLMYDVYNYLSGGNVFNNGAGTNAARADTAAYTTNYSRFRSPLSADNSCAKTVIIFVSNPNNNGPRPDDASNGTVLNALGGSASPQLQVPVLTTTTVQEKTNLGFTSGCSASAATCSTAQYSACSDGSYDSCACNASDATTTLPACAGTSLRYSVQASGTTSSTETVSDNTAVTHNQNTSTRTVCVKPAPAAGSSQACPATTSSSSTTGSNPTTKTTTTTSWSACYTSGANGSTAGCNGGRSTYPIFGTKSVRTLVEQTTTTTGQTILGNTLACYSNIGSCSTSDYSSQCQSPTTCACVGSGTATGNCPSGSRYQVQGIKNKNQLTETGTTTAGGGQNIDEWARFFHQGGVNVPGVGTRSVITYTVDVYNKKPNAEHTALMYNTADVGGGKYFSATNRTEIIDAFKKILIEIQAVNSAFASASLPVNATNRAQNENQVFIGMFRPDPDAKPLWNGNMKRYQLINSGTSIDLGDFHGKAAISSGTGFLDQCAVSWWTQDSGTYWETVISNPPARGQCASPGSNQWSDSPDGPLVEKGAVAQVIRRGNNPPSTTTTPTYAVNRNVKTLSSGTLVDFTSAATGLSTSVVDFILGKDTEDEDGDNNRTETRPSLHGDVVHSRPQPITYGSNNVVVYYGSNDGTFRAIDAANGKEIWAFIAPEFLSKLSRLKDNSPLVNYPNLPSGVTPSPTRKDYFFDGSVGVYQNADNSQVWIYPSMRRGGRKIYAFDVSGTSAPTTPTYKWSAGCPNMTDDAGCTAGMSGIGQTWPIPNVGFIKGYSETTPVVVLGGGYDNCEDDNNTTSCSSPKGNKVYILDANDGTLLATFGTTRSVAADVALLDINLDQKVDYAYVADTGGNIYRINFVDGPTTLVPLPNDQWTINRVAYTNGAGRKFLFTPALLQATNTVTYLAIGSGDREHPLSSHYPYTTPITNRFYVFKDDLSTATDFNLDDTSLMADYTASSSCDTAKVLPSSSEKGWFMSLNANGVGEQVVTSAVIAAGFAIFSTNRPIPPAAGSCSTSLGEARGYFVNLLNGSGAIGVAGACGGSRSSIFTGGGLPPSPVLATVPVGGVPKTVVIGAAQKSGGASSPIGSQQVRPPIAAVRRQVYWFKSTGDN